MGHDRARRIGATGVGLAVLAGLAAPAAAAPVSMVAPGAEAVAVPASRPAAVVRRVDVDGDGRSDRLTFALTRTTRTSYRFALTIRPARGRTVTMPVTVQRYRDGLTPAMVWAGSAPLDGAPGAELMLDLGGGVGDFPWLHAYTWRAGRLANLPSPDATRRDISWHVMGVPFAVSGYTVANPATGTRPAATTVTRHLLGSPAYDGPTYRRTHTTYRWEPGTPGGWRSVRVTPSGTLTAAQAQRYSGWHGITWR